MARKSGAWMEFNGRRSDELKVSLSEFPARPRAAEKGEWAEILGRSGALWAPSDGGSGEAWGMMEIKCALLTRPGANLTEIRRWLSGAGRLIFSDDSAHAFQARLDKALEVRPVGATGLHRITADFSCQPFRYLTAPGKISLNAGQTLQNPGSCFSEPIIRVSGSGSGTLKINETVTEISDLTGGVVIDSEARLAYDPAAKLNLSGRISGEWPFFEVGGNKVSFSGGITGLEIAPNWRWI